MRSTLPTVLATVVHSNSAFTRTEPRRQQQLDGMPAALTPDFGALASTDFLRDPFRIQTRRAEDAGRM